MCAKFEAIEVKYLIYREVLCGMNISLKLEILCLARPLLEASLLRIPLNGRAPYTIRRLIYLDFPMAG